MSYLCLYTGNSTAKNNRRNDEPRERFRYVHPERIELSFQPDQKNNESYHREGTIHKPYIMAKNPFH